MIRSVLLGVGALLSVAVAHLSHRAADDVRHELDMDTMITFLPRGAGLKVAAMGYHEPVADLMWIRSALLFGERYDRDADQAWGAWLERMLLAITELDPEWRTPYFHGGMMLRVMDLADASDAVFRRGWEAIPTDPFFPFALGMNHYLLREDVDEAARWIRVAADIPGAPRWYRTAAAGMLARKEMRSVAIRFLQEELQVTSDPGVRENLEWKLVRLEHDARAEQLEALRREFRERRGTDVSAVDELGSMGAIPPDPHGEGWILAPDGHIRSALREREEVRRAQSIERAWLAAR